MSSHSSKIPALWHLGFVSISWTKKNERALRCHPLLTLFLFLSLFFPLFQDNILSYTCNAFNFIPHKIITVVNHLARPESVNIKVQTKSKFLTFTLVSTQNFFPSPFSSPCPIPCSFLPSSTLSSISTTLTVNYITFHFKNPGLSRCSLQKHRFLDGSSSFSTFISILFPVKIYYTALCLTSFIHASNKTSEVRYTRKVFR